MSTAGKLVEQAQVARRERRLSDAQRDVTEAVALERKKNSTVDLARALTALGQIERDLGNGALGRHLADIDREGGNLEAAEPSYREALSLYRGDISSSPLDLANTVNGLAILLTAKGEQDEARLLTAEARDLYEDTGVAAGVAECSRRLDTLPA